MHIKKEKRENALPLLGKYVKLHHIMSYWRFMYCVNFRKVCLKQHISQRGRFNVIYIVHLNVYIAQGAS